DVQTTIVRIVNAPWGSERHQKMVMIGMRVIRVSSLRIPSRHLLPALAAVCRQMQIYAATQHVIRILRMHRYGISVRDLCFPREMFPPDFSPAFPAIVAPKNP